MYLKLNCDIIIFIYNTYGEIFVKNQNVIDLLTKKSLYVNKTNYVYINKQ